jgi:hypothetical protein
MRITSPPLTKGVCGGVAMEGSLESANGYPQSCLRIQDTGLQLAAAYCYFHMLMTYVKIVRTYPTKELVV